MRRPSDLAGATGFAVAASEAAEVMSGAPATGEEIDEEAAPPSPSTGLAADGSSLLLACSIGSLWLAACSLVGIALGLHIRLRGGIAHSAWQATCGIFG